jgi:hypothetical protein
MMTAAPATTRRDQEDARLVTGFADIFAAVVLVGVLVALVALTGQFVGAAAGLVALVAVWFLTVPLVEQRKFAATAIVLALSFAVAIALPAFALLGSVGALVVAGASYFYWQRFRIPLSAALGIAFVVAFPAFLLLGSQGAVPWGSGDSDISDFALFNLSSYAALFVGLALFAIAMRWDFSDRERVTRRSDVAFWLHLIAGPLTVHGLFSLLGVGRFDADTLNPWPVIALFSLFTLTALVIDRRPLLIASFGYFLFALGQIIYRQIDSGMAPAAIGIPQAVMLAALTGGLLVAVLAGAWSPLRRGVLSLLPASLAMRMPPPSAGWTPPVPRDDGDALGESEPVRLVLGLNDYLATLGMNVLFVGSLVGSYLIMAEAMRSTRQMDQIEAVRSMAQLWVGPQPWIALLVPVAVVCLAAEVFVRRQRMALTAVFASSQFALLSALAGLLYLSQRSAAPIVDAGAAFGGTLPELTLVMVVIASLGAAMLNWGFGWLNHIPASAGWGALMLVPLLFLDRIVGPLGFSMTKVELAADTVQLRLLGFGLALFLVAILLDRSDADRRTQRADVAFWLHLLASLVVIFTLFDWAGNLLSDSIAALPVFAGLTVVALAINRRAPLVVGIPFVLNAIDLPDPTTGFFVRLLFFAALMALVLYWDRIRARALALTGR